MINPNLINAAFALSMLALASTVLAPILYAANTIHLDACKLIMLLATIAWFVATPLWQGRKFVQPQTNPEPAP